MENIEIAIFQTPYTSLKKDSDLWKKLHGENSDKMIVPAKYYTRTFTGFIGMPDRISEDEEERTSFILEEVFMIFNTDYPEGYCGRSMSPGDVVNLNGKFYLRKSDGFQECSFEPNDADDNSTRILRERIERAERVLIDNGIAPDEAQTVLQALGYVLLDEELYPD